MRKIRSVLATIGIILSFAFYVSPLCADDHATADTPSYRYRITFDIEDTAGKKTVHVFANAWVYAKTSSALIGNPHPDLRFEGDRGVLPIMGGCLYVGRGLITIERSGGTQRDTFQTFKNTTIEYPVVIHDRVENIQIELSSSKCHKDK